MKMERRLGKKKSSLLVLLLLLLAVTVGYAFLSTTLNINGTTTIKDAKWKVYFTSVTPTTGSVTPTSAPEINATGTQIDYSVTLEKPGDYYEFTAVVKNEGTVVAKLSALPTLTGVSAEQAVYTTYTMVHDDDTAVAVDEEIPVGGTKSYKVRVEFKKDITVAQLPAEEQTLNLTAALNFIQK